MDSGARYGVGATFSSQIDDEWGYFVGGSVLASPGEGASWGDAITGGGVAGFTYQLTDTLRIGAGVGVSSRLEDDARVIPIPSLEWQINEQWELQLTFPKPRLIYSLNDKWKIHAGMDLVLGTTFRSSDTLGYVAFVDAGAASESGEPSFDNTKAGAGLGVRYYAGFGPLRADIAVPLDKGPGDADFQIYISIGQAF